MSITQDQKFAIKKIFDRRPIYAGDQGASQIVAQKGWSFVSVEDNAHLKDRVGNLSHVWVHPQYTPIYEDADTIVAHYGYARALTYKEFRKTVVSGFDCLMVRWMGMWLGIEKDGYTHS